MDESQDRAVIRGEITYHDSASASTVGRPIDVPGDQAPRHRGPAHRRRRPTCEEAVECLPAAHVRGHLPAPGQDACRRHRAAAEFVVQVFDQGEPGSSTRRDHRGQLRHRTHRGRLRRLHPGRLHRGRQRPGGVVEAVANRGAGLPEAGGAASSTSTAVGTPCATQSCVRGLPSTLASGRQRGVGHARAASERVTPPARCPAGRSSRDGPGSGTGTGSLQGGRRRVRR